MKENIKHDGIVIVINIEVDGFSQQPRVFAFFSRKMHMQFYEIEKKKNSNQNWKVGIQQSKNDDRS
jgi:hypothetical protein